MHTKKPVATNSRRASADHTSRNGISQPAVIIQPKWDPEETSGLLKWDKVRGGLQWFYNPVNDCMFFEVAGEVEKGILTYAGKENQKRHDDWIHFWSKSGMLDPSIASNHLVIPALTAQKGDYTDDETQALLDFADRQEGSTGMQYLLKEFAATPEVSSYLKRPGISEIIGRDVSKAESRKLEDDRIRALGKIQQVLPSAGGLQEVLLIGGSKDFVFPFLITGGQAQRYHMVSGELGNAEAIRKTIAHYSPANPATGINTSTITDGIRSFIITLQNGARFQVVSYDMLYKDFFTLKNTLGDKLGIPSHFDVTMDQMSWINSLEGDDSLDHYTASSKKGGTVISDFSYGGDFIWVLELLGLKKQAIAWEENEYLGYKKASVYKRTEEANHAAILFHSRTSAVFSSAERFGVDLDTDEGLAILSDKHPEMSGRLIDGLSALISDLGEENSLVARLMHKRSVLHENLPAEEEDAEDLVEKTRQIEVDTRWIRDNAAGEIPATNIWSNFISEDKAYTMANIMLGKEVLQGVVIDHRRLPDHKYRIEAVTKGSSVTIRIKKI